MPQARSCFILPITDILLLVSFVLWRIYCRLCKLHNRLLTEAISRNDEGAAAAAAALPFEPRPDDAAEEWAWAARKHWTLACTIEEPVVLTAHTHVSHQMQQPASPANDAPAGGNLSRPLSPAQQATDQATSAARQPSAPASRAPLMTPSIQSESCCQLVSNPRREGASFHCASALSWRRNSSSAFRSHASVT